MIEFVFKIRIFDFLVGAALIWGLYKGYLQGFIVHAIAMLALIAGTFFSAKLAMGFYNLLVDKSTVPLVNLPVIAFSLLFGLVLFGTNFVAIKVFRQVASVPLTIYTRLLGSFFGALKYLFISSVFMIFVDRLDHSFKIRTATERENTILYKPVLKFAPAIMPILHFDVRQAIPMELEDYTSDPEESGT